MRVVGFDYRPFEDSPVLGRGLIILKVQSLSMTIIERLDEDKIV